jgi:hypothetical protein
MRTYHVCAALLCACTKATVDAEPPDAPARPPFPSASFFAEDHVALPTDLPAAATPIPVDRLNLRAGFSRVQTAVIDWPEALDPSSLPGPAEVGTPGSVRLVDLTDGVDLPCFAELDAWPDLGDERPTLLVRAAAPAPVGHDVAVIVTTAVRTAEGQPVKAPAWQLALRGGVAPVGMEDELPRWAALFDRLATIGPQLGLDGLDEVAMAFGWPVSDGRAPLERALALRGRPGPWTLAPSDSAGLPFTYKQLTGSFTTGDLLVDDTVFAPDAAGNPTATGTVEAHLFVHFPASVASAPAGTAPVWIFGHGIFASPELYYSDADDPSGVLDLAERAGAIVVATRWRGLTTPDVAVPFGVGADFGRFPELTDKLVQGVANTAALVELVRTGGLLEDPLFEGKANPDAVRYFGISLGAIEGAVLLASGADLPWASLHVGGSTWSTMLERSTNWTTFESFVSEAIPSPYDRQLLYSVSQLFWDPVDPAIWVDTLRDAPALWQVAVGDDQVPNLTTWTLLRGVGAAGLAPSGVAPWGLTFAPGPRSAPAFSTFDPQLGDDDADNRPSPKTRAHDTPRLWEGTKLQTLRFLDATSPGQIEHFCGDAPCDATNPGPR